MRKKAFAPVVHRLDGKDIAILAEVTYGRRGYKPLLRKRFKTFDQAERASEKANRKLGLSEEESWLIVENTVMCKR